MGSYPNSEAFYPPLQPPISFQVVNKTLPRRYEYNHIVVNKWKGEGEDGDTYSPRTQTQQTQSEGRSISESEARPDTERDELGRGDTDKERVEKTKE